MFFRIFDIIAQTTFDPFRDRLPLGVVRLGFVFRGHFLELQNIKNGFPALEFLASGKIAIESVEGDLALALFRTVTFDTVFFEEGFYLSLEATFTQGNFSEGGPDTHQE